MTVLGTYAALRIWAAAPGALLDASGFPAWPGPTMGAGSISNVNLYLRPVGFASTFTVTTNGGHVWTPANCGPIGPLLAGAVPGGDALFPLSVSVNAGASGANAYAWYLSQRVDPVRQPSINYPGTLQTGNSPQLFAVAHTDNAHSGTVMITPNSAEVLKLFPASGGTAPIDAASLATMFAGMAIYCSRLSDSAYQWATFV